MKTQLVILVFFVLTGQIPAQVGRYSPSFIYFSEGCHVTGKHMGMSDMSAPGVKSIDALLGQRLYLYPLHADFAT